MITRLEALKKLRGEYKQALFIFSNGLTSRDAARLFGLDGSLYLLHAMGEALSIGIGLARAQPDLTIVVVDGDGNGLMGSASWVLGVPPNLRYCVLANGSFETTGGQELPAPINWPSFCDVRQISANGEKSPTPPGPKAILEAVLKRIESVHK